MTIDPEVRKIIKETIQRIEQKYSDPLERENKIDQYLTGLFLGK